MLESRSSYGYYGWAGGVTGENKPVDISDVDDSEYDGVYEEDLSDWLSEREWENAW